MRRHLTLEEISAWFDGELDLGELEHRHLRECAECGAVLDGHSRLRRLARKAVPGAPGDTIWKSVSVRLAAAPPPPVDRGVPASRALVPRGQSAARAGAPRPGTRRMRQLVSRIAASTMGVAAVVSVLLLLPRVPRRPAPPRSEAAASGLSAVSAELKAVQSRHGRITFELGSSNLSRDSAPALHAVAGILAKTPDLRVVVEGHTDGSGGAEWNLAMSRERARSVVRWLVDREGVDARRLEAVGFGSLRPIADDSTEAGQAANRRVEFAVVGLPPAAGGRTEPAAGGRTEPAAGGRTEPAAPAARKSPVDRAAVSTSPAAAVAPAAPAAVEAPAAPARQTFRGARFVLTADRFTTERPDLISAAGHVRVEPVVPGEPYLAVVDGFSRTLTGAATGVVGEIVNPGEHLILHTGARGSPVRPTP